MGLSLTHSAVGSNGGFLIRRGKIPLMSVYVKLCLRMLVLFLAVMTFPGLKDDRQRASVIAYLETLKP
jgi:hypothetical protein